MLKKLKIGILLFLAAFAVQAQAPDFKVDTLHHSGLPDSEAMVMTFVGDGFTASEQDAFVEQVRKFKDHWIGIYPITLFKDKFNIYAIRVVSSVSSGSNFPPTTYFGVTRGTNFGLPAAGQSSLEQVLDRYAPESNVIVLYVNSSMAAGVAHGFSSKYPSVAIQSAFNQSYLGVTTHEIGHVFGLRDEYFYNGTMPVGGEQPNATRDGNPLTNIWRAFSGIDGVGFFDFSSALPHSANTGWFRPTDPTYAVSDANKQCIMDQTNPTWRFCKVCQAHMVRRMASAMGETFLGGDDKLKFAIVNSNQNRIVNYAFYGMYALQNVSIASSVASIGDYAFLACTSLTTIVNFSATPQTLNDKTFAKVKRENITVYVPAASVAAYKTAWTDFNFKDILAITDQKEPLAGNPIQITRARVSSWATNGTDKYERNALYDGKQSTFWHARWGTGSGKRGGESFADLDLGSVQTITEIQVDGRAIGGNPQIVELRMLQHGATGNTFPNGESMGGNPYPTTDADVPQDDIDKDFAMTGWTAVDVNMSGLGTRNVVLYLETPITARYIRLGIKNANSGTDPHFTQVSEIRVFGTPCDHDWSNWETKTEATCEINGTEERYCKKTDCGKKEVNLIFAEGCVCDICGEIDCEITHIKCTICDAWDCTINHDDTSIGNVKKSDNRYGIKFASNIVYNQARISVVLPENQKAAETRIVIYDMTGNVVFSMASTGSATDEAITWNLTNNAGRIIANGAYLVVAEVKAGNGKIYLYSAKLGVKR